MDTKELILNISKNLFATKSFDGISMSVIAKSCNISKATIYHYFSSKGEIYLYILNEIIFDLNKKISNIYINDKNALSSFIDVFLNLSIEDLLILEKEKYCNFKHNINEIHKEYFLNILNHLDKILISKTNKQINNTILLLETIKSLSLNYSYNLNFKETFDESSLEMKKENIRRNINNIILKLIKDI